MELPFYSRSPRNHVAARHKGYLMCIVKIWHNHLKFKPISTNVFCSLNTLPLTTIVLIFLVCKHRTKYPFTLLNSSGRGTLRIILPLLSCLVRKASQLVEN